jgi:hypothetical protein
MRWLRYGPSEGAFEQQVEPPLCHRQERRLRQQAGVETGPVARAIKPNDMRSHRRCLAIGASHIPPPVNQSSRKAQNSPSSIW